MIMKTLKSYTGNIPNSPLSQKERKILPAFFLRRARVRACHSEVGPAWLHRPGHFSNVVLGKSHKRQWGIK